MDTTQNGEANALFQRIGKDGSTWLFSILHGGGWVITCNEQPAAIGTSERSSIDAGVKRFGAMARAAGSAPKCDPAVRRQLDRLEAARPHPAGIQTATQACR